MIKNIVVYGDCSDVLSCMPDESVDLTFTSPPYYNAKDYSNFSDYDVYLGFLTGVFEEVHRVTKEGRFFALNTSPVIEPRISRNHQSKRYPIPFDIHPHLIDMGWDFMEDIVWVKPNETVKNRNGNFFQNRKPLAYKPNCVTEYVMIYRKKTDKLIDWNLKQYDEETTENSKVSWNYEKTNLWEIYPAKDSVHPAVFPSELVENIIQFYSFKGDLVLDPFGGIGTVGRVALLYEREFLMIEKEQAYVRGNMQSYPSIPMVTYEDFKNNVDREV